MSTDGWPIAYLITFSTYGSRLHGDPRLTVDRRHNRFGEPFIEADPRRAARTAERLRDDVVRLTLVQQRFVEAQIPAICDRGGWTHHASSAAPDHAHVLLSAATDGKAVRKLLKRWLTEEMDQQWRRPPAGWWTECGSVRWIWKPEYFASAVEYIARQRSDVLRQ